MINLGGRLMPAELFHTLIAVSVLMALIILGALYWFNRSRKSTKPPLEKKQRNAKSKRRASRKK